MTVQMLEKYRRAYRELSVQDFRRVCKVYCIIYVIMNIFLIASNRITDPEVLWCPGAFFGRGAGSAAHDVKYVVKICGKLDTMEAEAVEIASRV